MANIKKVETYYKAFVDEALKEMDDARLTALLQQEKEAFAEKVQTPDAAQESAEIDAALAQAYFRKNPTYENTMVCAQKQVSTTGKADIVLGNDTVMAPFFQWNYNIFSPLKDRPNEIDRITRRSAADCFLADIDTFHVFWVQCRDISDSQIPKFNIITNNYYFQGVQVFLNSGNLQVLMPSVAPKRQSHSFEAATQYIRVIDDKSMDFRPAGTKHIRDLRQLFYEFTQRDNRTTAQKNAQKKVQTENAEDAFEYEGTGAAPTTQEELCALHIKMLEAEKAYADSLRLCFTYERFGAATSEDSYSHAYTFFLDPASLAKLQQQENEAAAQGGKLDLSQKTVSVSSNGPRSLKSIVVSHSLAEGWIKLLFDNQDVNKISLEQIAPAGTIEEELGIDYDLKLAAFQSLQDGTAHNTKILDIIFNNQYEPEPKRVRVCEKGSESQKLAVDRALATQDFLLVQGPPGTGKTTIILEMVKAFTERGQRVLITSKNNLAVDNVLEKLIEKNSECVRLCSIAEKIKVVPVRTVWMKNLLMKFKKDTVEHSDTYLKTLLYSQKVASLQLKKLIALEQALVALQDAMTKRQKYTNSATSILNFLFKIGLGKLPVFAGYYHKRKGAIYLLDLEIEENRKDCERLDGEIFLLQEKTNFADSTSVAVRAKRVEKALAFVKNDVSGKTVQLEITQEWQTELLHSNNELQLALFQNMLVVGGTCSSCASTRTFKDFDYDVVIVDEAGQITLHDVMVPLAKAKKVILIGDHMQLPPMADQDLIKQMKTMPEFDGVDYRQEYEKSLFEKLFYAAPHYAKVMLDTQFRMHRDIAEYISQEFYENSYKTGCKDVHRQLAAKGASGAIRFIDTTALPNKNEQKPPKNQGTGCRNDCEAAIIAREVIALMKQLPADEADYDGTVHLDYSSIGIVTPYKEQIKAIQTKLRAAIKKEIEPNPARAQAILDSIDIASVDSFQGRDKDIIFYSFVRSNKFHKLGFVNEVRRLNVTMTRAKRYLVMVGDSETLMQTNDKPTFENAKRPKEYFTALITYCQKNGFYQKEVANDK